MNTPDSQEIVRRFFEALDRLKDEGIIRGKQTFTRRYGINRWNMLTCSKDPARQIFQPAWLTYLVRDYGVSPRWLLTGEGSALPGRNRMRQAEAGEETPKDKDV